MASDTAGNFVVAWFSTPAQAPTLPSVQARRFTALARVRRAVPGEHHHNARSDQGDVAADSAGNFVVQWATI